jgi:DNA modification methylase
MLEKYLNKVINKDCFEYLKELPDKSVDLVLIDPPYEYSDYSVGNEGFDEKEENIKFIKNISNGFNVNEAFLEFKRILKNFNLFCFCSKNQLPEIMNWGFDKKYQVNVLIWKKGGRPFGITYLHDVEYIVHIRETGSPFNGMYKSRILEANSKRKHDHPTEKPISIVEKLVEWGSNEDDIVLDCFAGSGTTALACKTLNRNFLTCEIEEKYCKIAEERLNNFQPLFALKKENKEKVCVNLF